MTSDDNPRSRCEALWKNKSGKAFNEIKLALSFMSKGRMRCMYCEDNESTDIDHFWPKSIYPEKSFSWANYFFACSNCNSNFKRNKFPIRLDGKPFLIDPSQNDPADHLALSFSTGQFVERTEEGQKSIEIFGLQRQTLVDGRRNAFHTFVALFEKYDSLDEKSSEEEAFGIVAALRQASFSSVFYFLHKSIENPSLAILITKKNYDLFFRNRDFLSIL